MDTESRNIPERLKIQDQTHYVNVRSLSVHDFAASTYQGIKGYRDGTYLIPHPREAFYESRRNHSTYKNVFKAIIDAMITPVFAKDIVRETSNAIYQEFIDDCDGCGTPLRDMVREAVTFSRVCGVSFVVIDSGEEQVGDTIAEAVAARAFPYIYVKKPHEVKEYEAARGPITSITFYDRVIKRGGVKVQQYRRFTDTSIEILEMVGEILAVVETLPNPIGVIPVVPVISSSTKSLTTPPDPPYIDLVYLCYALYNKESELQNLELAQCFSILYTSGVEIETVGPFNYINCSSESKFPPGFASPDPSCHVNLANSCDRLKNDIYLLASQNGVVGVFDAASGVAKEWDFRATESLLKRTASDAAELEYDIAELFGLYIGQPVEMAVRYPEEFSPTFERDRIAQLLDAIDRMPPAAIRNALWAEYADAFWRFDEERAEEIKIALESEAKEYTEQKEVQRVKVVAAE